MTVGNRRRSELAYGANGEVALVSLRFRVAVPISKRYDETEVDSMANLDWSQCSAVESIPGKVSGAWVFKGTRMPVSTIFENIEAGMSVREITEVFDVTDEEVKSVLQFATRSLEKAPAYG